MSITRANAEFLIIAQVGPLLDAAGMDGSTVDGSNASLNGPIGRAIRALSYTVTDPTSVSNADVANVSDSELDEFLDLVTLYALEDVTSNLDDVDIDAGPRSEKLSQLVAQVERRIARLRNAMKMDYGYGLATLESGYITVDIAEHD